jgi:hypothetical protein
MPHVPGDDQYPQDLDKLLDQPHAKCRGKVQTPDK